MFRVWPITRYVARVAVVIYHASIAQFTNDKILLLCSCLLFTTDVLFSTTSLCKMPNADFNHNILQYNASDTTV